MHTMLEKLWDMILHSTHCSVFTGAGVSTLSGIRDFRGSNGIYASDWHGLEVEKILSLDFFLEDPSVFYTWAREFVYRLQDYQSSVVHVVLAEMENKGFIKGVYTQNIDLLHQKGGSHHVWELHGSPAHHHCLSCGAEYPYSVIAPLVLANQVPHCNQCQGIIKPDIVFYGEQLDNSLLAKTGQELAESDLLLILGSSLTVNPAASLPMHTWYHGGKIVIVNAQSTPLDRYATLLFTDLKETFEFLQDRLSRSPSRLG